MPELATLRFRRCRRCAWTSTNEELHPNSGPCVPHKLTHFHISHVRCQPRSRARNMAETDEQARHAHFMEEALREGELALDRGEVPVGAVFVYKGEIIARASNRVNELYNATKHAEIVAIEEIAATYGDQALDVLAHTTLYVTCEPCIMCASALSQVRIEKCFFGCHNDRFGGCSSVMSLHEKSSLPESTHYHGFPCVSGLKKTEAIALLKRFYEMDNPRVEDSKKRRKKPGNDAVASTA